MLLTQQTEAIKLHKIVLNGIAGSLALIFKENKYADKVLEKLFHQNKQWGSRDRKFVAEAVYDSVRYYRLLSHLAQSTNNFWFITAVYLILKGVQLPDWPEFKHVDREFILQEYENAKTNFNLFQSYPDDMAAIGENELGKSIWQREAEAMNKSAEVVLRVNTIKTDINILKEKLLKDGIETLEIKDVPNALILKKRKNIFSNINFKEGLFEIQDCGSQQIGIFSGVHAKQFVIDACAGAGGKSLHLAAMMQNKGRVVSLDVGQWKLDELSKRAKRAGIHNIETKLIENAQTVLNLKEKADVVLLDVPCSGMGVIKRNPDTKWKFNTETFEKTRQLQQQIFSDYSLMVKEGGYLIYSTCSILPSENKQQVDHFLEKNISFEFIEEKTIYPSQGFDGFYMCKLRKKKQT